MIYIYIYILCGEHVLQLLNLGYPLVEETICVAEWP